MKPDPGKKPEKGGGTELSMEKRLLLAFALMGLVLFLTPYIYTPPEPAKTTKSAPAKQAQPQETKAPQASPAKPPTPPPSPAAGEKEESVPIETELYKIVFSNRGAVVRSWILKKYLDNTGKPLELVNLNASGKVDNPFSLVFPDKKPEIDLSQALFAVKTSNGSKGIEFQFSDGKVFCRKSFQFQPESYLVEVSSEVMQASTPIPHLLAWRGGFGDATVHSAASTQHSLYFDLTEGSLETNSADDAKEAPLVNRGSYSFAGVEDSYFTAVALPETSAPFELHTFGDTVPDAQSSQEIPHVGIALGGAGRNHLRMFIGPKDIDILRRVDPKLEQVVDFGWFALLAKPLFLSVNWLTNNYVHNYGWSIVIITVIINFLLLPLKFTSLKSMKHMQVLQPQIAAINERYKGIGLRDPRKSQQNQEIMDLYKKHGVNPMGGCMPMLLQIPFFIAFYKVLTVAIEMRGAKWLWVTDLSQPEHLPIHILPIAMIVTQFIMQKMTPTTTADPTQQRVMLLMPLMFGFMFYNMSSGLVLYWLTGNVVGIAQQWVFNRTVHAPAQPPKPEPKKKGSRK